MAITEISTIEISMTTINTTNTMITSQQISSSHNNPQKTHTYAHQANNYKNSIKTNKFKKQYYKVCNNKIKV